MWKVALKAAPADFTPAEQAFERAVNGVLQPEDTELHFDLGIMHRELGMPDAAIHEMGIVLQNAPDGPNAERALSVVLDPRSLVGSVDEALVVLRELLFAN